MARLDLDDAGGGTLYLGPGDARVATARTRHGERWLATEPLADEAAADGPEVATLVSLLEPLVERAREDGAQVVHWETDDPEGVVDAVARALGLTRRRDILHLRRPLPLETDLVTATPQLVLRPFRPGSVDEAAWVRCNNRAFVDHPDQGHETVRSLRATMAEPWFDPAGLLLVDGEPGVDDGGHLDGFCWTRVHPAAGGEVARGEIYVIGIDPGATGRSLGRTLTVAGLDHLAQQDVPVAMLYVESDNEPARRLYDRLAFTLHHTRRVRSMPL
ncbi:MAG: mycothiol synthase [Iamia sp.]